MPYCPECGKSVAPNAKFCRNCGASQVEEPAVAVPAASPAAPAAAPVTPPATPEAAPAQVKAKAEPKKAKSKPKSEPKPEPEPEPQRVCSSCGKPVGPGEKVCGACAAAAAEPDVPEPEEPVEPVVIPPVQPVATAPSNICASCGSPIAGNERFCGICGAVVSVATHAQQAIDSVAASFSQAPITATPPPPAYTAAPSGQTADRTCRACGNVIKPGDKFCGKCCAKVVDDQPATQYNAPPSIVSTPLPPPAFTPAPVPSPADQSGARTCRACGNIIKPGDKFCSKCLVRVVDNQSAAPATPITTPPPPPAFTPAATPLPPDQSGTRTCRACGNLIKPGDKFCSKCLVRVVDNQPAAAQYCAPASAVSPPPPPVFAPATAPTPADQSGTRTCRACGNIIKPGDKFCSKCLVRVADNQPSATVTSVSPPPPSPAFTPAAASSAVCPSCGSPINGPEKFCGICGASIASVPAPAQPFGKFCGSCGASVSETTRFCGTCGAPTTPGPATATTSAGPPTATPGFVSPSGETVMGVIGNAKKMKMLGASWDTYNLVITDQRMILAQMTQEMINTAVRDAQAASKAEGKGFLSQMMHQMSAMFRYSERYFTMSPDQALAENPANKGIGNRSITSIKMKIHTTGSEGEYREFKMLIEAPEGKFEFLIAEDDRFTTLLRQVYGDKVHMPFGYISTGMLRIKLF